MKSKIKNLIKKVYYFLKYKTYRCKSKEAIIDYADNKDYLEWIKNNEPDENELNRQKEVKFENMPKISILVPMYETPKEFFVQMIDSLKSQTYGNWELCLADGSPKTPAYVDEVINSDERIKYEKLDKNGGISYNTNGALKIATGDYIGLLDHDDLLLPFTLYEIVKSINENPDAEFLYTDEDKFHDSLNDRYDPSFKPDFSEDTLRSYNYITHLSIFKRSLMEKLGGFRSEFDGSQDYDIILRATEMAEKIVHIPKVLYSWRVHRNSTAMMSEAKPYAYESAILALTSHLERKNIKAKVKHGFTLGFYKIDYELYNNTKVSIIISNICKYKQICLCLNYLLNSTYKNVEVLLINDGNNKVDFNKILEIYKKVIDICVINVKDENIEKINYATMNNLAVSKATGEYIVFMDANIRIITTDFIEEMLGLCQRENVGMVGAKILYPNNTIESAGYVLGMKGNIGNVNRYLPDFIPGYYSRAVVVNNYSAVSSKCAMIKKSNFEIINGYDKNFENDFYDVDLCLKLLDKGFVNVYNSFAKVNDYVKISKNNIYLENDINILKQKWYEKMKSDRYFNPNLRLDIENYLVNKD